MNMQMYTDIRNWLYRNARAVELSLWQYYFESGTKEAVVDALMFYQNEDGGFGHALKAGNWNPNSTPFTTNHAIGILRKIGFTDQTHPIYHGIWNYLSSEKDMTPYGWRFTIPSNDAYPHASWWNYSEEQNKLEYYGITAELSAFIITYGDRNSALWMKAQSFSEALLTALSSNISYGNSGLEGLVTLASAAQAAKLAGFDYDAISRQLAQKIHAAIERNSSKWAFYTIRPSNFIHGPESPFYPGNEEIVKEELNYLVQTKPEGDVWPITWSWFENTEKYESNFHVSENWWKASRAIENVRLLRSFAIL